VRAPLLLATLLPVLLVVAGRAGAEDAPPEPIAVLLAPGEPGSPFAPRYSPKASRVALAPRDGGALEGRLRLGPEEVRGEGSLLVLSREAADRPFDRLVIDTDGDGSFEDEATRTATPREVRGTIWTSFDAVMQVRHAAEGEAEPYPIGLWVTVQTPGEVPAFVRYSRRGFLEGRVEIEARAWQVVLSDADNDAVYGEGDWWALLPADGSTPHDVGLARRVGDFAWAGPSAFRLTLEGTRGRAGRLVPVDPGLTPEEDARARDRLWDDKQAERAIRPVSFRHDVDAAVAEAKAAGTPCFLDFETVWCGPCKDMDRWVWTAKDVVAAAAGIVCVKVDADERKDLKEAHGVEGFPTGILLAGDGREIARFRGYQGVRETAAFLARAHESPTDDE